MVSVDKFDLRFLRLAREISSWSKDPSKKIGCVVVNDKRTVVSQGYNGFPRNFKDTFDRLNNRQEKYKYVVHAEMNAIFNASFNGVSLHNTTFYVWGLPICNECVKGIIQCGVKRVVMVNIHEDDNWNKSFELSKIMMNETGVVFDLLNFKEFEYHNAKNDSI